MSLLHQIALTQIKDIGPKLAKNLIQYFGDAEVVFSAPKSKIERVEGIAHKTAEAIIARRTEALEKAKLQMDFVTKHQIKVLTQSDPQYPKRLRNCHDAPLLLYYKGTADLNHPRIVSVVGTRNASAYGKMICKQLIEVLSAHQVLVVSGLAHGIDAAAHRECVAANVPTLGVLGHGLDRIYPAVHRELAAKMLHNGGLLTEFVAGTLPSRENFPQRNRIIAGIADVTLVVEASIKGGALITAEIANSYNRDVYAFPGRINDEFSEGCNFLIKTNRAALLNHAQDLVYYLAWDNEQVKKTENKQIQLALELSTDERRIAEALQEQAMGVDELALATRLSQSALAMLLLTLEMKGVLVSMPGKIYKLA